MVKSIIGGGDSTSVVSQGVASTSSFSPFGQGSIFVTTTEANATHKMRAAGTLENIGANVTVNTFTGAGTIKARIAGADGNNSIAVPAVTTGWLQDLSHSDSIAAGDNLSLKQTTGTGAAKSMTTRTYIIQFTPTTGTRFDYGWTARGDTAGATAMRFATASSSACVFHGICGRANNTGVMYASELTEAKFKTRTPGRFLSMYVRLMTNTRTTDSTVNLRVNATSVNNVVTLTATTTGLFEDTSHTDTIATDDLVNMRCTTGTGTGNLDFVMSGVIFQPSAFTRQDFMASFPGAALPGTAAAQFCPMIGSSQFTVTESDNQLKLPYAVTLYKARVYLASNAGGANTFKSRLAGADGNIAVAITAAGTGFFEDNSHQDSVASGVLINWTLPTSTSTNVTFHQIVVTADPGGSSGDSLRPRRLQMRGF